MTEAEEKKDAESREEGLIPTASSPGSGGEAIGQIGPYKLLRVLGEGGFGVVYLAQQERPVKRKVALKVIKPGMDSKQVIVRFEAERQALALLDHPNIASVFNAGTTEAERPYFVMELVKGIRITEYCDKNNLDTRERLKLFIDVCKAVQHAHQKGIIHRDIKPSNVMITLHDGVPVPKIIDFGVAKAISQPLTERTLVTEHGQLIGTPEYMSPEQAEMSGLDVDTRSDIYSLGVLLYELLTGATPFDAQTLREAGYNEMQRIIREQEPARPSTRLSSLGQDLTDVAKHRHAEPAQLCKIVRGDLDWIVLKTLEKDRTRRYETANGLARDIERHLSDEPVAAGPPSTVYRMTKFVRRNRTSVTAAAIVLAAVLVGLVVSTTMYLRAEQAREREAAARTEAEQAHKKETAARVEAVEARAEAERQAKISQAVADFLENDVLASVDPAKAKSPEVSVSYFLDAASDSMADKFAGEPLVEASICQTLGSTYLSLGKYEAAQLHLERARDIHREQLGEEHPNTLRSMHSLALLYHRQGRWGEAEPLYVKVLQIQRRVLGEEDPDTLTSMDDLAFLYGEQGRLDKAESLNVKTLELRRRVLGEEYPFTLHTMRSLARLYSQEGHDEEAEPQFVKILETSRRVLGEEHPDTLGFMSALGEMYHWQGRYEEAESLLIKALEGLRRVLGEEHPDTLAAMGNLTYLYMRQERYEEAEPLLVKILEKAPRVLGEEHPETLYIMRFLAEVYIDQGRYAEAETLLVKALKICRRVLVEDNPWTLGSMEDLGLLYRDQGRYEEAEALFIKVLEGRRRVLGEDDPDTLACMNNLIEVYEAWGKEEKAEEWRAKLSRKEETEE
jgi:serine/threonine protein kinase/tetratricopeptide (TPR) repeat protein